MALRHYTLVLTMGSVPPKTSVGDEQVIPIFELKCESVLCLCHRQLKLWHWLTLLGLVLPSFLNDVPERRRRAVERTIRIIEVLVATGVRKCGVGTHRQNRGY